MKQLNTNSQSFKIKMKAYCGGLAFMTLMCATAASQAMNPDADETTKFYIQNTKTKEYLYVSDNVAVRKKKGIQAIQSMRNIPIDGIFMFEKDTEGTRIKHVTTGTYLLATDYKVWGSGYKYIGASRSNNSGGYLEILKKRQGLVMKTKNHEYIRLSKTWKEDGKLIAVGD